MIAYNSDIVDNIETFYDNAFNATYQAIWGRTPCRYDIPQMTYSHAHNIFLKENTSTEIDRRKLLYYYCTPYNAVDRSDTTLNKAISVLPTNNLYVKRVMRALCSLYANNPVRSFDNPKSEEFEALLVNSGIDVSLREAHKSAKLNGEVRVRPYFEGGKLSISVINRDRYSEIVNKDGLRELWIHETLVLHKGSINDYEHCFHIWNEKEFRVESINGENWTREYLSSVNFANESIADADTIPNVFGVIPYLKLTLNGSSDNAENGLWELIRGQLDYNRLTLMETNNAFYNGFSMMAFINFGLATSDAAIGAGTALFLDNISDDQGLMTPHFENMTPDAQYQELSDFKKENIKNIMRLFDLPSSMIDDNTNVMSGVAMQIERIGLAEYRREDEDALRRFDAALMDFIAVVYNVSVKATFTVPMNSTIEYIEDAYPTDKTADYELATTKFNAGLIDLQTYMNLTTSYDQIDSNDKALEIMQENIDILNKVKGLRNGNDTIDGNTTTSDGNTTTIDGNGTTEPTIAEE